MLRLTAPGDGDLVLQSTEPVGSPRTWNPLATCPLDVTGRTITLWVAAGVALAVAAGEAARTVAPATTADMTAVRTTCRRMPGI
jgi:hypothetical protein